MKSSTIVTSNTAGMAVLFVGDAALVDHQPIIRVNPRKFVNKKLPKCRQLIDCPAEYFASIEARADE